MPERVTPARLLRQAAELYDDEVTGLRRAANGAWRTGFGSGGHWMQAAIVATRDRPTPGPQTSLHLLGFFKYSMCLGAAVACASFARASVPAMLLLAVAVFYAVEAQMVFLFPVAIDGSCRPFGDARKLSRRAGGTLAVMRVVLPIAVVMIFGGLVGRGFVRSWCLGCLSICVWYEQVLARPERRARGRLELANNGPLEVREERVAGLSLTQELRLLYVSDLHLGHRWTDSVADQIAELVARVKPDAVLLGGDLADNRRGIEPLRSFVERIAATCPVYAISGNHDRCAGVHLVQGAIESAGGTWLEREPVQLGGIELHAAPVSVATTAGWPKLLVAHDPSLFPHAIQAGCVVTLAGHLHGGQCVLVSVGGRDYPGAFLSRWTGLRFTRDGSTLIVSRGAADTLPIRWNCPREVVLCTLC